MKYRVGDMSEWVRKCKARQEAVAKTSIQKVTEQCGLPRARGGRMPVVTSTLRDSMVSELNGQSVGAGTPESAAALVVANMRIGDKVGFGWTAEYARRVNSGMTGRDSLGREVNQSGAFFLEFGIDQWPSIVAAECAIARSKIP